ncbi:bifunctional biotin--[acetyl-CoA-carboxylase] ligase/biotin operon repressor BirA [Thiolapillus sp.]
MNTDDYLLLGMLADAEFHSGELLAQRLSITRAAVWKRIRNLNETPGIDIESVRGKGYRLSEPLDLLHADRIRNRIDPELAPRLPELHLLPLTPSTNDYLLKSCSPMLHGGHACVAEYQTAGRGRRGRQWACGFGRNVYLSLAWRFDLPLADLAGLSIAVGVAVARVLTAHGLDGHGLKWPNDIHIQGKKLAGILVEAKGEMDGPCQAVIGVGLNVNMPESAIQDIDQPWTDIATCLGVLPDRNGLIGDLLNEMLKTCVYYQQRGLAPFLAAWKAYDIYLGKEVELLMGDNKLTGTYVGLNERGGLVMDGPSGRQAWYSGEVSLRGKA